MRIEDSVIILLSDQLGISASEVQPEKLLKDDLGADSFDSIDIIMEIESEFDIEVSEEDSDKWKTVKDVVEYIEAKKTAGV